MESLYFSDISTSRLCVFLLYVNLLNYWIYQDFNFLESPFFEFVCFSVSTFLDLHFFSFIFFREIGLLIFYKIDPWFSLLSLYNNIFGFKIIESTFFKTERKWFIYWNWKSLLYEFKTTSIFLIEKALCNRTYN